MLRPYMTLTAVTKDRLRLGVWQLHCALIDCLLRTRDSGPPLAPTSAVPPPVPTSRTPTPPRRPRPLPRSRGGGAGTTAPVLSRRVPRAAPCSAARHASSGTPDSTAAPR